MTADPNKTSIFGSCETCGKRIELTIELVLTYGVYLGSFSFALACPQCASAEVVVTLSGHDVEELIRRPALQFAGK
jgi:hypothetical protein